MADIRSSQVLAQVEYIICYAYTGDIPLTLVPEADTLGDRFYTGDVAVTLTPQATTFGDFVYAGDVSLSLTPESVYSHQFCYPGSLLLSLSPGATYFPVIEYLLEASGGISIQGEGTVAFFTPSTFTVAGSGGWNIGGVGVEAFVSPPVYSLIAEGGLEVLGEGSFTFVEAPDLIYTLVGLGGFALGGRGSFVFINVLPILTLTGFGGYKLSGAGIAAFEDPEILEYVVVGSGGYKLEGEGNFVYVTPSKIFSLTGTGEILFFGIGKVAWFDPDYFSVIGSGGVVISGEGETDEEFVYFTWVFSGVDYKPSVYSGYNFNSYCNLNGKVYGACEEGIFELSGKTDDGVDIHTGFILGPHNLGVNNKKRLRSIHLGNKNIATKIRVTLDSTSKDFSVTKGKAKITRNLMGEEVTLEIADFEELSVIEVTPVVLGLRG